MIHRDIWLRVIYDDSVPPWPCPSCGNGVLVLDRSVDRDTKKEAPMLVSRWTASSSREWEEGYPYPDGVFAAILRCHQSDCGDVVAVSGTSSRTDHIIANEQCYREEYRPLLFTPPLHFFRIEEKCPPDVREEVISAFRMFWCDTNACLNHIRSAVELLLTSMRVLVTPTYTPLGNRIAELQKTEPALAEHMSALKWLGNFGSHAGTVTKKDSFDGFDLLEHIFRERFSPIGEVAKEINANKGPRK
jgi:hypothetical protein